ncbi:MAG: MbnP family protein [Flavobacteriales bacterium]|jgi:hypothetical protein|tara:strand:+ start:3887 stop:4579 length:693 start_codon:yes stop_codon:yes gene_type:complete
MKHCCILILFLISFTSQSQNDPELIQINPLFNNEHLELNKQYFLASVNDSIKVETLKFFISNVRFFQDEKLIDSLSKKQHLIDLENEKSLQIEMSRSNKLRYNTIKFSVGIDSITNVSGVFGGDLDPTNGMYWTWQSGYVNFKLEGKSKACSARNNFFQYHLGGYQAPYKTISNIELKVSKQNLIVINFKIDAFLNGIDLAKSHSVMSPNDTAVALSKRFQKIITIRDEK